METDFKQTKIYVDTTASSSEESGTSINPCKTFSAALAKLTDSTRDYTILIRGTVVGNLEITGTPLAKSITIRGATGLNASGAPQDSLDGNEAGTVLKIDTQKPVILQNIEIKNGKTTQKGNGILNKGKLTILSGTFIRNNKSVGTGGGIYNQGELYMLGGIISDNKAVEGAGIYNADVGKLEIKGGEISDNYASDGGGIFLTSNSGKSGYTQISGGKISGNSVESNESKGAAIYADTGSVLKMKGDFYIPYDNEKINDVYIYDSSSIKITGNLTPPQECTDDIMATITLKDALYASSSAVISLDTSPSPSTTMADVYYKFKITPHSNANYGLNKEGEPKTIIGTKAKANAVGDIVFKDGSAISKNETLTTEQKNSSIAVIFYKGTGLNNGDDITTVRTLGVGVVYDSSKGYMWCKREAKAYYLELPSILWATDYFRNTSRYSGVDYNGSDNFEEIAKLCDDTNVAGNYPVFEYAKNYKSALGTRLSGSSLFDTGWFVPTVGELWELMLVCREVVRPLIINCGGNFPSVDNMTKLWTSNSRGAQTARFLKFWDSTYTHRDNGDYTTESERQYVLVIHEF